MIVLAVAAVLIAALLLVPIRIYISYHTRLEVRLRVLFLRFDIIPRKKKEEAGKSKKTKEQKKEPAKKEAEKPPDEPAKEEKKEAAKEERGFKEPLQKDEHPNPEKKKRSEKNESPPSEDEDRENGIVDTFFRYYALLEEFFEPFKRVIRLLCKVQNAELTVQVGTADAADTAAYTGMLWAAAYNILGLISRFLTVEHHSIKIEPMYNSSVLSAWGSCIIRTNIANIICAAAIAGAAYLRHKRKNS